MRMLLLLAGRADPWPPRAGCPFASDVGTSPRSAGCRAARMGCRRGGTGRGSCCRSPSGARPAARAPRRTAGCPKRSKHSLSGRDRRVLRGMKRGHDPPSVSIASESGVTSSSTTSRTVAGQHGALDGGADGDDLVRVDALVRAPCRRSSSPAPARAACGGAAHEHRPRRLLRDRPASLSACKHGPRPSARPRSRHDLLELSGAAERDIGDASARSRRA